MHHSMDFHVSMHMQEETLGVEPYRLAAVNWHVASFGVNLFFPCVMLAVCS
jgi:hypothetical protein